MVEASKLLHYLIAETNKVAFWKLLIETWFVEMHLTVGLS